LAITKRAVVYSTPWFELLARNVDDDPNPYYALSLPDYVCVVALTADDQILLVRQFRPAVERRTLELPAGVVDKGESPEAAAARELIEETGYKADSLELLGQLNPDTGRLSNKQWCFFASGARPIGEFKPEAGIEVVKLPRTRLASLIKPGELDHALHLGCLMLASLKHGSALFNRDN